MRRALALGATSLGLVFAQAAAAAPTLTLQADRTVADFGAMVTFSGTLTESAPGTTVRVYRAPASAPTEIAATTTAADGTFSAQATLTRPGPFFAVAFDGATQIPSAEIALPMRPALSTTVVGIRSLGAYLAVKGRIQPDVAGKLYLYARGVKRRVWTGPEGGFRAVIPTDRPGPIRVTLALTPAEGYVTVSRVYRPTIRAPYLRLGSRGAAVYALERGLRRMHYALRRVDRTFGYDTYQAVLAFQKVHGMSRTGRAGSAFWSRFRTAGVPLARVRTGDHIEVSKTKQVLFEVRAGKVVNVVHVSTGATGNTPVGKWRVYRLGPGGSLSHMYYSMYFLRGFAIHGYHSVPPWPASHGCVRTPLWIAPGMYSRWGRIGTVIYVFG